jgi:hypothetical protein
VEEILPDLVKPPEHAPPGRDVFAEMLHAKRRSS